MFITEYYYTTKGALRVLLSAPRRALLEALLGALRRVVLICEFRLSFTGVLGFVKACRDSLNYQMIR